VRFAHENVLQFCNTWRGNAGGTSR
jgi:hypothetical protein